MIEIGAVVADARTFDALDDFTTFIRPVRHPRLTPFCMELTHISQQDVESAPLFRVGIAALLDWLQEFPNHLFCSWGDYDRKQFERECAFNNIPYPFEAGHVNLKKQFSEQRGLRRQLGMAAALRKMGLELQGTHHRGIDDARNITRLLPHIFETQ